MVGCLRIIAIVKNSGRLVFLYWYSPLLRIWNPDFLLLFSPSQELTPWFSPFVLPFSGADILISSFYSPLRRIWLPDFLLLFSPSQELTPWFPPFILPFSGSDTDFVLLFSPDSLISNVYSPLLRIWLPDFLLLFFPDSLISSFYSPLLRIWHRDFLLLFSPSQDLTLWFPPFILPFSGSDFMISSFYSPLLRIWFPDFLFLLFVSFYALDNVSCVYDFTVNTLWSLWYTNKSRCNPRLFRIWGTKQVSVTCPFTWIGQSCSLQTVLVRYRQHPWPYGSHAILCLPAHRHRASLFDRKIEQVQEISCLYFSTSF